MCKLVKRQLIRNMRQIVASYNSLQAIIKSFERSEDSYIGLGNFFIFFFQEKFLKRSNDRRSAFIDINAVMNALRLI